MSSVDIKRVSDHELAVEWVSSVTDDMIADSVVTLVLGIDSSPASVKSESRRCSEPLSWSLHRGPPLPQRRRLRTGIDTPSQRRPRLRLRTRLW